MAITFKKATKEQAKLRLALSGPSGSGKTRSALEIATAFGGKIALGDTEYGSASKYANLFNFDTFDFGDDYAAERWIDVLRSVGDYDFLILDSLSHAWNGRNGILERHQAETKRKNGNSYAAWDAVTPVYKSIINAILSCPAHVIVTLRAKQDYVQEKDDRGKTSVRKIGMAPEIREGFQYEMDVEGMLDWEHNLIVGKTRCEAIDGKVYHKPGKEFADALKAWLTDGAPPSPKVVPEKGASVPEVGTPITPEQADQITKLIGEKGFPSDQVDKWFARANVKSWMEFPAKHFQVCLEKVQAYEVKK